MSDLDDKWTDWLVANNYAFDYRSNPAPPCTRRELAEAYRRANPDDGHTIEDWEWALDQEAGPDHFAGCYICQPEKPDAAEEGCSSCDRDAAVRHLKWTDLFGIDPDFTGGLSTEEYLRQSRGEA